MPRGQLTSVLRHIRRLAGRPADGRWTDRQLLRRFAAENDEAAFALLVERHGPMVLSVCRRILRHQQDAEDAFQATFLVLARKAGAVAWRESAGGWLYEVAQRVAHGARRAAARRHGHERRAAEQNPERKRREATAEQPSEQGRDELRALLDEELRRLPEKYRAPLVLCYLESYSHTEAARHLGWAVGTVKGRLARARDLLQRRLAGRDIALPAAALGAVLAEQAVGWAVPVTLVHATVKLALVVATGAAAGEAASATVAALADGLLRSLAVARLKAVGALLLAFSVVAAGAGLAAHRYVDRGSRIEGGLLSSILDPRSSAEARGDPLPPGAVVRLGTPRFRHGGTILDVAFSPDGTLLATAGDDNSTRLWDPATGRELRRLAGHTGPVRYIAFAPHGRLLASAGDDQTVRVWDTATGREVGPPVRFRTGLSDCYGFDRGATTLAFLSPDQTVHFWDVTAGTDISEDPRLAPRGRSWKLPDGAKAGRAALSADGKLFALALAHRNRDTAVHLWDVAAGEELRRFGGGGGPAGAVAFTPDGKTLAVAAGELTLWDVATGARIQKLPGPRPPCRVCFSPDGRFLASSGEGDRTVLWDLTAADGPRAAWESGAGGGRVAFSSDSRRLAWCTDRAVHLLDTAARKELPGHTGHAGAVELVAFAPDGRTVVSVGDTVRAWDAATGKELGGLPGPIEARAAVALARDGRTVAVGMPGTAVVRDVATGKVLRSFPAPGGHGLALALSPDGRTLAMHGTDQLGPARETSIRLCDVATGEGPRRIGENEADVTSLAFAPDGTKLAARGSKHIRVWDVATGTRIADISVFLGAGAIGEAAALSLSPDGRLLAAADSAHAVRVWDVGCGQEVRRFSGHRSRVRATAFAPDGSTLVSAAADGTLRLWDVASGKLLHEVPGHQEEVLAVAVSPDGRRVASAGADTTVLIWDVAGLKDIGRPPAAPVAPGEFPGLWADLAATNTPRPRADRAMRRLAEAPASAVSFLKQRLRQESEVEDRVKWLIAGLDSDLRAVRARSTRELRRLGKTAAPALRNALAGNPSPEARLRIEVLLRFLADNEPRPRKLAPEELRLVRAAVVLARIGTPEATAALRALAANHALRSAIEEADFSEQPLVNEAKAALEDLKGQPAPGQ